MDTQISIGPHARVELREGRRPRLDYHHGRLRLSRRATDYEAGIASQQLWLERQLASAGARSLRTHSIAGVSWTILRALMEDGDRMLYCIAAVSSDGEREVCPLGIDPGEWLAHLLGWSKREGRALQ
jgi:hypothetical protein